MTVEGHSLTQIVRELGVSEPYARIWMSRARFIMAMDAEKRQAEIVFGQLVKDDGQETVAFIEADETCVFSWREALSIIKSTIPKKNGPGLLKCWLMASNDLRSVIHRQLIGLGAL